jgi:hypothetical protein
MRAILLLIAALIAGPVCIFTGVKEFKNSKALQAQGKVTLAQVVDGEERVSRKGRRSYSLTVSFAPEGRGLVTEKRSVSRDVYEAAAQTRTTKVVYLPSNPTVFQFGEKAETKTGLIIFGSLVLFGALGFLGYLFFQWRSSKQTESAGNLSLNAGANAPLGTISVNAGTPPVQSTNSDLPKAA